MKKYFFLSLLISSQLFGQTYVNTTVYTPKGTAVQGKTLTSGEWSVSDKETIKNQTLAQHQNATFLAEATNTYNCHGYAWHIAYGGTPTVWINQYDDNLNPNVYQYWTDGSYIQVCNESEADNVHYYTGDHSAITSVTVGGKYESKWGSGIRVRHDPTDVPSIYNGGYRNYYASTAIWGSQSNLCTGTKTLFVKNISGATYSWTYSSNLLVSGPTNTNQITVQRNGGAIGAAWVEVQISTPCSGTSATRRADLKLASPDVQGYYVAQVNGSVIASGGLLVNRLVSVSVPQSYTVQYSIELSQNLSAVTWNLYGIGNITSATDTHLYWTMPAYGSSPNNCTVILNAVGECGPVSGVYPFQVTGLSGYGYSMIVSPNPATNQINVQIMPAADTSSPCNSINASTAEDNSSLSIAASNIAVANNSATTKFYLCDLYSNIFVKQWQFKDAKSPNYTLNIAGVKTGTYILKMERENKIATTKVIVR